MPKFGLFLPWPFQGCCLILAFYLLYQELVRLLQQTLRSSQCERRPAAPSPGDPAHAQAQAHAQADALLQEREGQVQALCGHMERLALEKDSLQQELKTLKIKVGEINEQLGMLMETIQAKDEVIIKLSQQSDEEAGQTTEAGSPTSFKDLNELVTLKVGKHSGNGDEKYLIKQQNRFTSHEVKTFGLMKGTWPKVHVK